MTVAFAQIQEELRALKEERAARDSGVEKERSEEGGRSECDEASQQLGKGSPPRNLGQQGKQRSSAEGARDRDRSRSEPRGKRGRYEGIESNAATAGHGSRVDLSLQHTGTGIGQFAGPGDPHAPAPPWSSRYTGPRRPPYVPIQRDYQPRPDADFRWASQFAEFDYGSGWSAPDYHHPEPHRPTAVVRTEEAFSHHRSDNPIRQYEQWISSLGLGAGEGFRAVDRWFRSGFSHEGFPYTVMSIPDEELPEDVFRRLRRQVLDGMSRLREAFSGNSRFSGPSSGHNRDFGPSEARVPQQQAPSFGNRTGNEWVDGRRGLGARTQGGSRKPDGFNGGATRLGGSVRDDDEGESHGKQVAGFLVTDADGRKFSCTSRSEAMSRVLKLQGMIRIMGADRFECLVKDLVLDMGDFIEYADNYIRPDHRALGDDGHPLYSLRGAKHIKDTPVVLNKDMLASALRLDFKKCDLKEGSLTLKSFLVPPDKNPVWGRDSSPQGRRAMGSAIRNLEKFLSSYGSSAFDQSLTALVSAIEEGFTRHYHDIYVWVKIQRMLGYWSADVRTVSARNPSSHFPGRKVDTPEAVAQLLRLYTKDLINSANGNGAGKWEESPHSRFYSADDGDLGHCLFDGAQQRALSGKDKSLYTAEGIIAATAVPSKAKEKEPKVDAATDKEAAESRKAKERASLCGHHLRGLMGIKFNGELRKCDKKTPCLRRHVESLGEITLAEAHAECDNMMMATDKQAMDAITTWKPA